MPQKSECLSWRILVCLGSGHVRQVDWTQVPRLRTGTGIFAPRRDRGEGRGREGDRRHMAQPTWEAIAAAAKHSSVKEINDRKGYLAFKHRREKKTQKHPSPKGSRD